MCAVSMHVLAWKAFICFMNCHSFILPAFRGIYLCTHNTLLTVAVRVNGCQFIYNLMPCLVQCLHHSYFRAANRLANIYRKRKWPHVLFKTPSCHLKIHYWVKGRPDARQLRMPSSKQELPPTHHHHLSHTALPTPSLPLPPPSPSAPHFHPFPG